MSTNFLGMSMGMAIALVACADPGSPEPMGPYTLTFVGGGTAPGLLVARDGDGPWQSVALPTNGSVSFDVTSGYHGWAVACRGLGAPPRQLRVNLDAGPPPAPVVLCLPPPTLHVSGQARPSNALVSVDGRSFYPAPDGAFDVDVRPGAYDVAAVAGSRMILRRGEAIQTDRTIELDTTTDGFDTLAVSSTVVGAVEQVTVYSVFRSAGGAILTMPAAVEGIRIVPAERRMTGDRMLAGVGGSAGNSARFVQRLISGNTVPDLPFGPLDPTPSLTANRGGMDWSGTHDEIEGLLVGAGPPSVRLTVNLHATGAWQTARGGSGHLEWIDPASLPGWDATSPMFVSGDTLTWQGTLRDGAPDGDHEGIATSSPVVW